ncbi:hypothetical protein AB0J83_45180 [Actinoplanes sp. NPDC049596]|uniref:hypothetical protein n=1 Tax=unclassified Actinoplanes TaxID=2626549 RepID=UPI00341A9AE3
MATTPETQPTEPQLPPARLSQTLEAVNQAKIPPMGPQCLERTVRRFAEYA